MKHTLINALLAFTLSACVGNVISGGAACNSDVSQIVQITGECSRTIETLDKSATQHIGVQTSDVMAFATIDLTVTVETGTVEVTVVDSRGNTVTEQASPGSPATISVPVRLDPINQINFDLAPVDGPAENVEYELTFLCDCMP